MIRKQWQSCPKVDMFLHSFNKYLLSTCYVPDSVLGYDNVMIYETLFMPLWNLNGRSGLFYTHLVKLRLRSHQWVAVQRTKMRP